MPDIKDGWWKIEGIDAVDSPSLLIYLDRAEWNIQHMIEMAGGTQRLRPHIKTHKLSQLVRMHIDAGIDRFKCATVAEAEMAAQAGAADVLLAYQPVGPKVNRLLALSRAYPETHFSTIADCGSALEQLATTFATAGLTIDVLLDIDCGMNRTGIAPGPEAVKLYERMATLSGVRPGGLHAYDGHITEKDAVLRAKICENAFLPVLRLRDELLGRKLSVPRLVAGGTPTFPIHARNPDRECSPGTCVLWDAGYAAKLPEMDFRPAALVLTRVVSKPGHNRLCLDLGHKAIAAENPHPRVVFMDLPDASAIMHSEEHLVVESPHAGKVAVGHCFYGLPWHVCPTVALHSEAVVIRDGKVADRWKVTARERQLRY